MHPDAPVWASWSSPARFIYLFFARPPHIYQKLDNLEQLSPLQDLTTINTAAVQMGHGEEGPEHVETVPGGHKDKAAELLDSAAVRVQLTAVDNRRVLRKIDLVILPILLTVYFLQGLDKATLAYASVFGLITDTNLVGEQYSWLGSIVYIAQLVMQPPIAYFLVKFPIGKFTGVVVLGWGIVLCCMAVAHDFSGLMATRFFLGAFEASVGEYLSCSAFDRSYLETVLIRFCYT